MNRKVTDILRTTISPDDVNWDKHLDDVQFAINNSVMYLQGRTPTFCYMDTTSACRVPGLV